MKKQKNKTERCNAAQSAGAARGETKRVNVSDEGRLEVLGTEKCDEKGGVEKCFKEGQADGKREGN